MGTLLTPSIYNVLCKTREQLEQTFGADNVSGIHMPWAGDKVCSVEGTRSLYVVGIAPDKDYYPADKSFDTALSWLEEDWRRSPRNRSGAPWWRFVGGLTEFMYKKPHHECTERWGGSNIFKIACNDNAGEPNKWPPGFVDAQRDACILALRHEFSKLKGTIIFIGWHDAKPMLDLVLPTASWEIKYQEDSVYFWRDDNAENIYIWGDHPNGAIRNSYFDKMLTRTRSLIAHPI